MLMNALTEHTVTVSEFNAATSHVSCCRAPYTVRIPTLNACVRACVYACRAVLVSSIINGLSAILVKRINMYEAVAPSMVAPKGHYSI